MSLRVTTWPESAGAEPGGGQVLLNRSALTEAKVRIGDVVSVAGGVARVQLSDDVAPEAVAVPAALRLSLKLRVDDLVAVAPHAMPIFESEAVHLVAHTEAARAALAGGKDLCVAATSEQLRTLSLICQGQVVFTSFLGRTLGWSVASIRTARTCAAEEEPPLSMRFAAVVSRTTSVRVTASASHGLASSRDPDAPTVDSVGGQEDAKKAVLELLDGALRRPHVYTRFGLRPPRGLLLHGPPGTGKTMLARTAATAFGCSFIARTAADLIGKYFGESEAHLRQLFADAAAQAPCIIFLDELDALCPRRDDTESEAERRVVATLLTLMDGIGAGDAAAVVVLAATNRPDAIDQALRRPGRLDREIEVGTPSAAERLDIFRVLLARIPHSMSDAALAALSARCHGYVGADMRALVEEAGLVAVARAVGGDGGGSPVCLTVDDFAHAFVRIRPSAMREVFVEVPKVRWADIGGQEHIKQQLREAIQWPLQHADAFDRMGITPPKGVLLYGPPGCSKTMMAKALATEAGLNFIAIKGPELFNKWVGESERAIRTLFRRARAASPSIIFLDEIDAIASQRTSGGDTTVADRVLSQLLAEIDGVEGLANVTVVAATNRPDVIDKALLRPGRLDRKLYVPPPDEAARAEILRLHLSRMPVAADVSVADLARRSLGFSGAETASVCREAALLAMQEDLEATEVKWAHFERAVTNIRPRISADMLAFYARMQATL